MDVAICIQFMVANPEIRCLDLDAYWALQLGFKITKALPAVGGPTFTAVVIRLYAINNSWKLYSLASLIRAADFAKLYRKIRCPAPCK